MKPGAATDPTAGLRAPAYVLKPGDRVRLELGTFGPSDYLEVIVRADGRGLSVRAGEGGVAVLPSAGNEVHVRRVLFEGDERIVEEEGG